MKTKHRKDNTAMKKNILFIIPTLCGGGAEKTVANLSLCLEERYNVYIALFKDTPLKYEHGGRIVFLGKKRKNNALKKLVFFIKSVFMLKKIKQKYSIDYAISFLTPADFMNVLSRGNGKCKTFLSIRNTDSILMSNIFLRKMTEFSCRRADKIISISDQVRDDLVDNFKIDINKIITIYNPAAKIEFGDDNSKIDESVFGDFTFINIGRLVDQKGQWHLIRSFSVVVKENSGAKLIILGQGPNESYLNKLIDAYGISKNVSLLGFVDNPYKYMDKADCFVFASLYEGLGNVLLESLACGLPIISTDCVSGPREILDPKSDYRKKVQDKNEFGEYGILCPVFDGDKRKFDDPLTKEEKLYSEAMINVMKNRALLRHYQKQSLIRARDFSMDTIAKKWEDVLC